MAVVPRVANPETDISVPSKTWSSMRTTVIFATQINQPAAKSNYQCPTVEDCSDDSGTEVSRPTSATIDSEPENTKEPSACPDPTPVQEDVQDGTIVIRVNSSESSSNHSQDFDSDHVASSEPDLSAQEESEEIPPNGQDEETKWEYQVYDDPSTAAFLNCQYHIAPGSSGIRPGENEDEFDSSYDWKSNGVALTVDREPDIDLS